MIKEFFQKTFSKKFGASGFRDKSTEILGIGQEFNYATASKILGALGIPQPKRLATYEQYANLYGSSVWVYAAVYQITSSLAGVPFQIYEKKNGKYELITDENNDVVRLFNNPNPYMSFYEFMEGIVVNLELIGNSYIEEVTHSGSLEELWPLQAKNFTIIPGKTQLIEGYVYESGGRKVWFKEEEITHIKYVNPISDFYGASPLTAAEVSVGSDIHANIWNRNFFKNSARADAVLETDGQLNDTIIRRLKTQWKKAHQGTSKAHNIAILEGGLKYTQTSLNQSDMEFISLRKFSREEILAAYGVHSALIGIVEKVNNSIMANIRRNFWENTLMPKLIKIENSINRNIVKEIDSDLLFKFDVDSIEALKESRETRAKIAAMLTDRGIFTINEVRKEMFNKEGVDWGDTWHMPMNLADVDKVGKEGGPGGVGGEIGGQSDPNKRFPSQVNPETFDFNFIDFYTFYSKQDKITYEPVDITKKKGKEERRDNFLKVHQDFEEEFVDNLVTLFEKQSKNVDKGIKQGKTLNQLNKIIDTDKKTFRVLVEKYYKEVMEVSGQAAMDELLERVKQRLK